MPKRGQVIEREIGQFVRRGVRVQAAQKDFRRRIDRAVGFERRPWPRCRRRYKLIGGWSKCLHARQRP